MKTVEHTQRSFVPPLRPPRTEQTRSAPVDSKLPDGRMPGRADCTYWQAGAGLTAIALDLEPSEAAVEALADRWRRLRRATVPFHPDRPCFRLGAVGLTGSLLRGFARSLRPYFRADDPATVNYPTRLRAHGGERQQKRDSLPRYLVRLRPGLFSAAPAVL